MKLKIILILILLLFLLVGCASLPSIPFLGGKQDKPVLGRGLKMQFMSGAPPVDRIMIGQGSRTLVRVGIDNYGPKVDGTLKFWDNIPGGLEGDQGVISVPVTIEGGTPVFGNSKDPGQITNIVASKNFFSPEGISGKGEVQYVPDNVVPGMKLNIFAELSIPNYPSYIQTSFCLKREADVTAPCSNQEVITSSKLGPEVSYLPVTVDRIEKTATPYGEDNFFVDLKIVLRNLGGGELIGEDGKKDRMDRFEVLVDNGAKVTCSPDPRQGQLVFNNNEAVINCAVEDLRAGQSYTDHTLRIGYSFPYRMRIKAGPIPLVLMNREGQDNRYLTNPENAGPVLVSEESEDNPYSDSGSGGDNSYLV